MDDDNSSRQLFAVAPPTQRIIQPFNYFPVERAIFFTAIICLVLGFPILLFRENIRVLPFGFLCVVIPGCGIILLAITIAEIHFRRLAVSTLAIVTRERRLVENYFAPQATNKATKQVATKLPTIEVQFTTQVGEPIILEVLTHHLDASEIGQPIMIYYLPKKPQVAVITPKPTVNFALAVIYTIFGAALIVVGIALFR